MTALVNTLRDALGVAFVPYVILLGISFILSVYYHHQLMDHVRDEKRRLLFFHIALLLCRDCLDNQAYHYQRPALWSTIAFWVLVIVGLVPIWI